jgi:hypothetical protein
LPLSLGSSLARVDPGGVSLSLGDYKPLLCCQFIVKAILLHGEGAREKKVYAIVHARNVSRNQLGTERALMSQLGSERAEHNRSRKARDCVAAHAVDTPCVNCVVHALIQLMTTKTWHVSSW